jgi:hypothetical protein
MKYYTINEEAAANAKAMYSWFEYKHGTKTAEYKSEVDEAYSYAEALPEEVREKGLYMADKYAQRLADWYNKLFSIEMRCPSVMIAGGSNFPVRKKEKQVSALDKHYALYGELQAYKEKIKKLANSANIIKSSDSDAIDKLKAKIEEAQELQATMKAVNAYYRKHGTLTGYGDGEYDDFAVDSMYGVPYPPYCLTNNNAKIRAAKQRIKELEEAKGSAQDEAVETNIEGLKVVENTEAMRIQLIFDDKPSEDVRDVLKSNGFRWSPRFSAWQRHLNSNGKYAVEKVLEILKDTAKEGRLIGYKKT